MKPDDYLDGITQKAVKELANELGSRLKRDIGDEVGESLGQFLEAIEEFPAKTLREACAKQDQVLELLNGRLHSSESAMAELGRELERLKEKVNTTLMEKAEAEARKEKALREKAEAEGLRQSLFNEKAEVEETLARIKSRSAKESDELKARIQSIQNDLAETTELAEIRSREKSETEKELQETNSINQVLKARLKSYAVSRTTAIILASISLAVAGYIIFTSQSYPDRKRGADRRVEELNAVLEIKDRIIGELSREQNRLTARVENLNKQVSRQTGRPVPPSESKEVTYRTSTVVYFPLGSIGLSEQGAVKVRLLAEKIKTMAGVLIRVEGHTDNKPLVWTIKVKHIDNKGLSQSRASAVARLLIDAGVDKNLVSIVGLGSKRPIAPNDSPENRAKNRRVEIKVTNNGG